MMTIIVTTVVGVFSVSGDVSTGLIMSKVSSEELIVPYAVIIPSLIADSAEKARSNIAREVRGGGVHVISVSSMVIA